MECTTAATTVYGLSKTLNHSTAAAQIVRTQLSLLHVRRTTAAATAEFRRPSQKFNSAAPLFGLKNVGVGVPVIEHRLACVPSAAATFASSGGGGVNSGVGGGGGGGDGGEVKADPILVGGDDVSPDVIVLDVGGMTCGGCSSKVKRILESQPLVSAASVDLTTKMAIVWPVPEAKVTPNWQIVLGGELAKHLTTCGFISNLRGEAATKE